MVDARIAMASAPAPTGAPQEPLLAVDDIQGNVVPGFMKPLQYVIALQFGEPTDAKRWLRALAPALTTTSRVMPSRLAVRAERLRRRVHAGNTDTVATLDDAWVNVAFSYGGLAKLLGPDAERLGHLGAFEDEAFARGLAARSSLLGDPADPASEGDPRNWIVGGPGNEPDAVLVLGADRAETMARLVAKQRAAAESSGITVVYAEGGAKLNPEGREHFGFRDGVSQPGPRGRISDEPDTFLTPRAIAASATPAAWFFGLPGQYLVWPGEFVFGYEGQGADPLLPGTVRMPGPEWSRNGSYLVFRRLRQDVAAFRAFVAEEAARIAASPGFRDVTPDLVAAWIVGRWPSGAPLARAGTADIPALGDDPLANNHFGFAASSHPLPLVGGGVSNTYPEAVADPIGLRCPLVAHIRKVNTRDAGSDQGGRRASFARRILRVGLPFGPPLPADGADPAGGNRGLLFLSYQTSIVEQFEFLNAVWMGDPTNPRAPSGHDLLVGQNGQPGEERVRMGVVLAADGSAATITAPRQFVTPTGGGYFFSPSVSAIEQVLAVS